MHPILTITLNPTLDVTTSIEQLKAHQKLRCSQPRYDPGGGGVNVSRAIKELGGDSHAFVAIAGAAGQHLRRLLDAAGIDGAFAEVDGETRITFQVMEEATDRQYRFILPGPPQSADAASALLDAVTGLIAENGVRFVVASGSLLPGLPEDFYGQLATRLRDLQGVRLIVDTSGPALKAAFRSGPYLIKPNRHEAQELFGGAEISAASAARLAEQIARQDRPDVVIVTFGAEGAMLVSNEQRLLIRAPEVEVVSMVGAGDSFIGAVTLALARGWPLADAARFGVAAAASAVTTQATALCRRDQTEHLFQIISDGVEAL